MINFKNELDSIRAKGLERKMLTFSSACGPYIKFGKKKLLNLCANNYLGLADDNRLKEAAIGAIKEFGVGAGASRLVSGSTVLHKKLEEKLADFKKQEACLVYPSGYSANLGIIPALVGRNDIVFSDRFNHASIIDGIILSRAELARYPHKDVNALEEMLVKFQAPSSKLRRRLIVTDSVFSMDGDIAPLPQLLELAQKYDCLLMIDEAHATGVLGKKGRGALEHFDIKACERIIVMGTLSKAFGGLGGYVCGNKDLIDFLVNRSRAFIFTTALPAPLCVSSIKVVEIIEKEGFLRKRLSDNARYLREGLEEKGFDTLGSGTPIIPVLTKDPKVTMDFSRNLFREGIFVQGIRPPTVPEGASRLRATVMATHTKKDLDFALDKFKKIGHQLKLI